MGRRSSSNTLVGKRSTKVSHRSAVDTQVIQELVSASDAEESISTASAVATLVWILGVLIAYIVVRLPAFAYIGKILGYPWGR